MNSKSALILARTQHSAWKLKMNNAILSGNIDELKNFLDYTNCDFGKWYYKDGISEIGNNPTFKSLEEPHKKIHDLGHKLIDALKRGEKDTAARLLGQIDEESSKMYDGIGTLINQV